MSVSAKHPDFCDAQQLWQYIDDAMGGEFVIKNAGEQYLPKSNGMKQAELADAKNKCIYDAFKTRADYPHWVKDSLRSMGGLASKLKPEINIPNDTLKSLIENATADGFGLEELFIRIIGKLLQHGRYVLLVDVDDEGKPFIATYTAHNVINWKYGNYLGRQDLSLVTLTENVDAQEDEFSHDTKIQYRVLDLTESQYRVRVFDETEAQNGEDKFPSKANKSLDFIPVVFCGSTKNSADIDEVPMFTMAKAAVKFYQISAEYYQELHHTSHPQPWVSGLADGQQLKVTGAMSAWILPVEAKCGYLEITGTGIEAKRLAMQDQKNTALEAGARTMDTGTQESGDARIARQRDQQASLFSIVMNAASAVEQCLKYAAEWLGYNPDEYSFAVKPDFAEAGYDVQLAQQIFNAAIAGNVSMSTYWDYIRTGKLPEHGYEIELARIENPNPADVPA